MGRVHRRLQCGANCGQFKYSVSPPEASKRKVERGDIQWSLQGAKAIALASPLILNTLESG